MSSCATSIAAPRSSWCVPPPAGCPPPAAHLSDGSYLAWIGYGVLPVLIEVRVKAQVIDTLADGTVHREQWRLLTSRLRTRTGSASPPAPDDRRPGDHRQQQPAHRPGPADRRDRQGRPGRTPARLATSPHQGPHAEEPHQRVRTERGRMGTFSPVSGRRR
jgi:hypothetical protein